MNEFLKNLIQDLGAQVTQRHWKMHRVLISKQEKSQRKSIVRFIHSFNTPINNN